MLHFMKIGWILPAIFLCLLQTGCSSETELGNTTIVSGLFLDYSTQESKYHLVAEIVDMTEKSEKSPDSKNKLSVLANTVDQAFFNLKKQVSSPLYFSHAKLIILGESLQEISLKPALQYLMQQPKINSDIPLVATDISATEFLETDLSCKDIYEQLAKDDEQTFKLYQIPFLDSKSYVLPRISFGENGVEEQSQALFSIHKIQEVFQGEDWVIYLILTKKCPETIWHVPSGNIILQEAKSTRILQDDTLFIHCNIVVEGYLLDTVSEKNIEALKHEITHSLTQKTTAFFHRLTSVEKIALFGNTKYSNIEKINCDFQVEIQNNVAR